jgi:hypothetical protein
VAGSCKYGDELSGSGATDLVCLLLFDAVLSEVLTEPLNITQINKYGLHLLFVCCIVFRQYLGGQKFSEDRKGRSLYRVSSNELSTFKTIQKTNAAHSELHTNASR